MDDLARSNRQPYLAPEFGKGVWLGTEQTLTLKSLRSRVVLVDMWDYSCINCLRSLPHVRRWHDLYHRYDLTTIGVHSPAFDFGRERTQVELALLEQGIQYPVLLDNRFDTWNAFQNRFWPTKYLIDQHGRVRYVFDGEGRYGAIERAIQTLIYEIHPNAALPPINTSADDDPELPVCPIPELRGGLNRGALGNPEGYAGGIPMLYCVPPERTSGAFYVGGAWSASHEYITYQGRAGGVVQVPYAAGEVYAVLTPHVQAVERMLHTDAVSVEIWQDDRPLPPERRGGDITADGRILVDRPRAYNLVRNPDVEEHEITLRVHTPGFALYALSFVQ